MSKTETGTQAFKDMITMETKISISITDKVLKSDGFKVHGESIPTRNADGSPQLTDDGFYKEVSMTISTYNLKNDRMNGASVDEKLNAIGVHERGHLSKEQIPLNENPQMPFQDMEQAPVMLEFQSRMEYYNLYGGNKNMYLPRYKKYLFPENFEKVMRKFP